MNCNFYFDYKAKGYATDAKTAIKSITQASEIYYNERGDYPENCIEDMISGGFIDLKQSTLNKWEFDCQWPDDSGVGGWIEAFSTGEMTGGGGHTVFYKMDTGIFSGYGQDNKE